MASERRSNSRINVELSVKIRVADGRTSTSDVIRNISLGGVCVEVENPKIKLKGGEEFSFAINLDYKAAPAKAPTTKGKKAPAKSIAVKGETVKGKIAWSKENGKLIGLTFSKISDHFSFSKTG